MYMSLTPDFVQAILSQFSQKTKASTDETDEAVDNAELASLEEVTCDEEQELDEDDSAARRLMATNLTPLSRQATKLWSTELLRMQRGSSECLTH